MTDLRAPLLGRARFVLACTVAAGATLAAGVAQALPCADDPRYPCAYALDEVQVLPAPNLLKFQARVSQAKQPLADGVLGRVVAHLRRGSETVCTEEYLDVRVAAATINLDVGRNASCELDRVLAGNPDLNLQICIGGGDNCLRPIALATVPYAIKSTFAGVAQKAVKAENAGVANYAHRMAADAETALGREPVIGYFNFHTPSSAPSLYTNGGEFAQYANGGFLLWSPLRETAPTLHIAARNELKDSPVLLSRLVLAANTTDTLGGLEILSGGLHVSGSSTLGGTATVRGQLKVLATTNGSPHGLDVTGDALLKGELAVAGSGTFARDLSIASGFSVTSGGAAITGASDIAGSLTTTQKLTIGTAGASLSGDATVAGNAALSGDLDVTGALRGAGITGSSMTGTGLSIGTGGASIAGTLQVTGTLTLPVGAAISAVAGDFNVPGTLTANDLRPGYLRLANTTDFSGGAARPGFTGTIDGELNAASAGNAGLLRLSAGGGTSGAAKSYIDVSGPSGNAALNERITMFTANSERLRVEAGKVTITGDLAISGSLTTAGSVAGAGAATKRYYDKECTYVQDWSQASYYQNGVPVGYGMTSWQCTCDPGDEVLSYSVNARGQFDTGRATGMGPQPIPTTSSGRVHCSEYMYSVGFMLSNCNTWGSPPVGAWSGSAGAKVACVHY